MNLFVLTKLIFISIGILLVKCQEEDEPESEIYLINKNNQNETELNFNKPMISTKLQPIISSTTIALKEVHDISIEPTTTTTTSTTSPTTTPTTIETTVSSKYETTSPEDSTITPLKECIKISLDAKINFKYNSTDGINQEIQLTGGNINGELIHPNKCEKRLELIIKYEQISGSQLILWININETHVYVDEMRFEVPIEKLPVDYKRPENTDQLETCSSRKKEIIGFIYSPFDKCLVANNKMFNYLMQYRINEQINCLELPIVTLETNNKEESIEVSINNFNLIVSKGELDIPFESDGGVCPLVSEDSAVNEGQNLFAGHMKIWIGVTYAIIGGVLIFGIVLLYEKVIRKRFSYTSVERKEPEV